jgi:hypothetical protein
MKPLKDSPTNKMKKSVMKEIVLGGQVSIHTKDLVKSTKYA